LEMKNKHPLIFIKSWNEWAEGNMLEPVYQENWSAGEVIKQVLRACREGSATRGTIREVLNVG
jgi:Glycosyltransferase WbsX